MIVQYGCTSFGLGLPVSASGNDFIVDPVVFSFYGGVLPGSQILTHYLDEDDVPQTDLYDITGLTVGEDGQLHFTVSPSPSGDGDTLDILFSTPPPITENAGYGSDLYCEIQAKHCCSNASTDCEVNCGTPSFDAPAPPGVQP